ncbi:hypothetical protein T4D_11705 [Trichinella pseudospiralis]|uniref:Uncharacterized protein n=1 Tax=Trichinella pseudospiralis TaxID=6337 RepID=A0A0V1FH20_TRIPS|nr:hypothetical protein T4D_11705 [Trichinella pseudospiralis]
MKVNRKSTEVRHILNKITLSSKKVCYKDETIRPKQFLLYDKFGRKIELPMKSQHFCCQDLICISLEAVPFWPSLSVLPVR